MAARYRPKKGTPGRKKGFKTGKPAPNSKYDEKYVAIAKAACEYNGAIDDDLARLFGVNPRTIRDWQTKHPEFRKACVVGKDVANKIIERTAYQVAKGYDYEEELVKFGRDGKAMRATVMRHQPPNATAIFFWLQNRMPDVWRNVQRHEHTGKDGTPMTIMQVDPEKLKGIPTEDLEVLKRIFTKLQTGEVSERHTPVSARADGYAATLRPRADTKH